VVSSEDEKGDRFWLAVAGALHLETSRDGPVLRFWKHNRVPAVLLSTSVGGYGGLLGRFFVVRGRFFGCCVWVRDRRWISKTKSLQKAVTATSMSFVDSQGSKHNVYHGFVLLL